MCNKKISFFLLIIGLIGLLYSCNNPNNSSELEDQQPQPKYTVTYKAQNAESGTVPVDTNEYEEGDSVTVLGNTGDLRRRWYTFSSWHTDEGGSGDDYAPGDSFSMRGTDLTLYAQWIEHTWQSLGSGYVYDEFAGGVSSAINSNDTVYVLYVDKNNNNKASVRKYDAQSGWVTVGSEWISEGPAEQLSIEMNSSDVPHVLFRDQGGSGMVFNKYENGSWTQVSDSAPGSSTGTVSLSLDSQDTPYVVKKVNTDPWGVSVYTYDGQNWNVVGSESAFGDASTEEIALAFDSSDTPYVAYSEDIGGTEKMVLVKYDEATDTWNVIGTQGFSQGSPSNIAFNIDKSRDIPYVLYEDSGDSQTNILKKFNGS